MTPDQSRYDRFARCYDAMSGERPVYRAGRTVGISQLRLGPGHRVLDVGCGTGLDLPLLVRAVGPAGQVIGVDASGAMLARARARKRRAGWRNVALVTGDAADLDRLLADTEPVDAALFTYALSVIQDWEGAWEAVLRRVRPGGRVVVVDLGLPGGAALPLRPLARLACLVAGADPYREPWGRVLADTGDTSHLKLRAGHVHVGSGTVRPR